ncbi:PREDICTED: transmembrane protease serine 5-like [Papilio xuthus]|uniref:Transmembrane protease serine 5-like n=1 Tax=Papilio xuthus TaxID=66420 RepID=A0AAJ7EEA3_PAPXU|nr:PREDICTED: transmembrane protease serine 5-like [Papilio xuthus]
MVEKTRTKELILIPHPKYVDRETKQYDVLKNDIGLIETNPMPLKRFIKLSPVDFHTLYGHEAVSGGFGITTKNESYNKTKTGNTLKFKKPLQIFKVIINKCMHTPGLGPLLCLDYRCGTIAVVCGGDSGGPVIHASGIVAVLSASRPNMYCGGASGNTRIEDAGFHCPVGPYVEWINSHVRN